MYMLAYTWINFTCIYIADATRKKLSPEAVPTLNLPKKLFESDKQPRRIIQKHETDERSETQSKVTRVYKHLDDLKKAIARVKLSGWSGKEMEDTFRLEYFDSEHAIPVYSVRMDSGLGNPCLLKINLLWLAAAKKGWLLVLNNNDSDVKISKGSWWVWRMRFIQTALKPIKLLKIWHLEYLG